MYYNEQEEQAANDANNAAEAEAIAEMEMLDRGYSQVIWEMKEGEKVKIANMDYSHVMNCRKFIQKRIKSMEAWLAVFNQELESRVSGKDMTKIYNQTSGFADMPPENYE